MTDLSLTVLVADDHPVNRFLVSETLGAVGCRVVAVEDGCQAVNAAAEQNFDVILLDVRMPVLNGFDAARKICKAESGASSPIVIMLTADECIIPKDVVDEGVFSNCIEKPLTIAKFLASLSKAAA